MDELFLGLFMFFYGSLATLGGVLAWKKWQRYKARYGENKLTLLQGGKDAKSGRTKLG